MTNDHANSMGNLARGKYNGTNDPIIQIKKMVNEKGYSTSNLALRILVKVLATNKVPLKSCTVPKTHG